MKNYLLTIILLSLFFVGCKNSETEEVTKDSKKEYDLYQLSEMALHMEYMFKYNEQLRQDILEGKTPEGFPQDFLRIHTAELTNTFERDASFNSFAELYINAEREIFNTESEVPIEERYNTMVNLCISCHQTSCMGPIPRIKKLLIPKA